MSTCKIELSHRGDACDACPDYVTFPIDGELLQAIAAARAMLSLDLLGVCPEIVLSLPDAGEFFVDCGDAEAEGHTRPLLQIGLTFARLMDDIVVPYDTGDTFFIDGAPVSGRYTASNTRRATKTCCVRTRRT